MHRACPEASYTHTFYTEEEWLCSSQHFHQFFLLPSTPIPAAMRRSTSMPCMKYSLDKQEAEVSEASAQRFSFPIEPWSFEGATDTNNLMSPALTASPAWSPQPRRVHLDPCAPLTLRISDFLSHFGSSCFSQYFVS